jgi:hypothetical protein
VYISPDLLEARGTKSLPDDEMMIDMSESVLPGTSNRAVDREIRTTKLTISPGYRRSRQSPVYEDRRAPPADDRRAPPADYDAAVPAGDAGTRY